VTEWSVSGVINFSPPGVRTALTMAPDYVREEAISAALYAAIDPFIPNNIFLSFKGFIGSSPKLAVSRSS
jgi:hypothetical protein